jgi:hypothetical protein
VNGNNFILRADNTTTLRPCGLGRNSFRLNSTNQYGTHVSVWVVDFASKSPPPPHSLSGIVHVRDYIGSTWCTCQRVVGELVAAFSRPAFSDDIARPRRTWPTISELGGSQADGDFGVGDFRDKN